VVETWCRSRSAGTAPRGRRRPGLDMTIPTYAAAGRFIHNGAPQVLLGSQGGNRGGWGPVRRARPMKLSAHATKSTFALTSHAFGRAKVPCRRGDHEGQDRRGDEVNVQSRVDRSSSLFWRESESTREAAYGAFGERPLSRAFCALIGDFEGQQGVDSRRLAADPTGRQGPDSDRYLDAAGLGSTDAGAFFRIRRSSKRCITT
jgi:hypothetical protein